MFLSAGDVDRAISIIAEYGWIDMLIKVGRQLDKADRDNLSMIAKKLKQLGASHGAAEIFSRLGDDPDVADVLVDAQAWPEAFELAERNPKLKSRVYGPYARWLAETGRFSEAQEGSGSLSKWAHAILRHFTFNICYSVPNGGTTGGIDTRTHDAGQQRCDREKVSRRLLFLLAPVAVESGLVEERGRDKNDVSELFRPSGYLLCVSRSVQVSGTLVIHQM